MTQLEHGRLLVEFLLLGHPHSIVLWGREIAVAIMTGATLYFL